MSFLSEAIARRLVPFAPAYRTAVSGAAVSARLDQAIQYATLGGGKHIRPYILLSIGKNLGVPQEQLLPAAVAVEMVHSYSLVHDDLPAMDDDNLRRGQPTVHRAFDEATAILVGDALLSEAFGLLANAEQIAPAQRLTLIGLLSRASGGRGMVGGQMLDLQLEGNRQASETDIARVQELKTGAIFDFCALAPAIVRDSTDDVRAALVRFGQGLGTLFQVSDDIIGASVSAERSGKSADSDSRNDKMNWVRLLGLAECRKRCDELVAQCVQALGDADALDAELEAVIRWLAVRDR